jgi:cephalosporin hydroxylase
VKISVDTDNAVVALEDADGSRTVDLYSPEGFAAVSRLWVTTGWGVKYTYGCSWMGRPILPLPEDMVVIQEVLYRVRPDVVIETGVAHGGSLVFYASLFAAMGHGRVIGIDIEVRPHNRTAIEEHPLSHLITLVEGSSVDSSTVDQVASLVQPGETVLVLLDSNHTRDHVLAELDAYAPMVTPGSYIVSTDGVMEWLEGVPGAGESYPTDNPKRAVEAWLPNHPEFELEEPPPFVFNESGITDRVTHWPTAYLRRR